VKKASFDRGKHRGRKKKGAGVLSLEEKRKDSTGEGDSLPFLSGEGSGSKNQRILVFS